ncbi:sialoadhesin [Sceloporus undulatus]|uniref:sialoadhesin n=1 Tax=Sceloporus undulatus TaxID=8520 RepID=UPI001C4D667D|nr:sialoadhesin [Sceloporus undulatus]
MSVLLFILGFSHYVIQAFASWGVTYPERLHSVKGSCAVIPCTFSFPSNVAVPPEGIVSIWYKNHGGQRIVIYHSENPSTTDAQFRDRTELVGDALKHNCTLLLREVTSQDSGDYNFRFEISEGNRWTEQKTVQLTITDSPEIPNVAAPQEISDGLPLTFNCSSPYVCPYDASNTLQWVGYNMETSLVSETVQLDTAGVLRKQSLQTSLTWKDHNQKLTCEVSVGGQRMAGEITLSVKHAPKGVTASLNASTKNIRVGDAATLTCNVNSSYPKVTAYRWFKDGVASGNTMVKTFRSVARGDYGLYHCEADNSVGTGKSEGLTLYVFSVVLSVSPSSNIKEGESVTLTCDVPGADKQEIHYSWYKNNLWIKAGTAQSLFFQEAVVGDTGYYSCKVQNDKGSETSQAVGLNVLYPPRTPSLALFQETQEGQSAIVHCTVDSNPPSTLSLYRDKRLLATTNSHSAPSQRITITTIRNSLKLEIWKVVPEDEGDYKCVATNPYGSTSVTHFFGAQTARVVAQPSKELPEGTQVTLTCMATLRSGEETMYTWYKNGKWLQEGKENSLVFPMVANGDAGIFHCVAQNKIGINTSPPITLRVLYAPRQPVMRSFLETQGGHLGIIQCTVDSDPPSEVALYKGDVLIGSTNITRSGDDPRVSLTSSYNALKVSIKDVGLEDEGTYVCSAQNRYGDATTSKDFVVETARIIAMPSSEMQEGESVHLSCALRTSNSSTSTNYTWYKDGLPLLEALRNSLEFQHVARKDAGTYYCQVETPTTSKNSDPIVLSVLYPPGNPQMVIFMETEMGRVAIFQISVDSKPPAQFVLYKGDKVVASSSLKTSSTEDRISITSSQNAMRVEMRGIVPEDEGSYNITATNAYGSSSRLLYFHVQTARVLVTPSPEVLEGDTVTLTCDVMGNVPDDSTFSWYKNSKRVQGSHSGGTLSFQHITSEEAGSYFCKVYTPDETGISISPSISITVFYPPRKPLITSFLRTEGSPVAVLQCTVESEPQAHLEISKGREVLASSISSHPKHNPPRIKTSATYNSLRVEIWDVVMEDEGDYVCSASNMYGNGSSKVKFTANAARIWITPPDVLEGNSVNLTCAVDSDTASELHYTWYKHNQWWAEGPSKILVLPHATVADAGTYYCTVKAQERIRNSSLGILNVLCRYQEGVRFGTDAHFHGPRNERLGMNSPQI